jgi:hypothetical protein
MPTLREKWLDTIRCFQNVTEYKALEAPDFCWSINYDSESYPMNNESSIYFILDGSNHAAFSHWVYESSNWLPFFLEVQREYPSCYLVVNQMKTFKKLYFDFYGIPQDCILVEPEIEKKNFCFFHTYTSLNDTEPPPIYYGNLINYERILHKSLVDHQKEIPLLYLPRGTKENFVGVNNRAYNIQNDLKELVLSMGGTVYETDTTTNLTNQIDIIQKSTVIVLDYGSNLWVNGFFARNSKLICLNIGWNQHIQYPSLAILWDKIQETNTITQIFAHTSDDKQEEDGVPIVSIQLPCVIQALKETLEVTW